jgi:hypothetical protein
MRIIFLILIFVVMPRPAISQDKYGFGSVVVYNTVGLGRLSKEIVVSEVINLDSLCHNRGPLKILTRMNKHYFDCAGKYVINKISHAHPEMLKPGTEIENLSQIEGVPDYRYLDIPKGRITNSFKKAKLKHKAIFMERHIAEKNRRNMLDISYRDVNGTVTLVD